MPRLLSITHIDGAIPTIGYVNAEEPIAMNMRALINKDAGGASVEAPAAVEARPYQLRGLGTFGPASAVRHIKPEGAR